MVISRNKIQPLIVIVTLLLLIWANFNVFYFAHTHVDENGRIIVHAHPYQKEGQQSSAPKHTHSKSEFTLLAVIYQILTLFTSGSLCFAFFFYFNSNQKFKFSFQWNPVEVFCQKLLRRGPPSLLQFA